MPDNKTGQPVVIIWQGKPHEFPSNSQAYKWKRRYSFEYMDYTFIPVKGDGCYQCELGHNIHMTILGKIDKGSNAILTTPRGINNIVSVHLTYRGPGGFVARPRKNADEIEIIPETASRIVEGNTEHRALSMLESNEMKKALNSKLYRALRFGAIEEQIEISKQLQQRARQVPHGEISLKEASSRDKQLLFLGLSATELDRSGFNLDGSPPSHSPKFN